VIQRKVRLAEFLYYHVKFNGIFAKGKIHCSCSMCAVKTNVDGFPHSQRKQLQGLQQQLIDFEKDNY
jgi:hypothetical protein